jgi:hypothetical protein
MVFNEFWNKSPQIHGYIDEEMARYVWNESYRHNYYMPHAMDLIMYFVAGFLAGTALVFSVVTWL